MNECLLERALTKFGREEAVAKDKAKGTWKGEGENGADRSKLFNQYLRR